MLDRVKQKVREHKTALLVILCLLLVGIAYAIGRNSADQTAAEKPAVMTQEQTQDTAALRAQLDISRANAQALQKRLAEAQAGQRAPTVTYHVSAPTVERAAQVVERQIRTDDPTLPKAAREKSDRTVVTPITKDKDGKDLPAEEQKVDVYKINLRKDHRIKAGASVIDGKALMSIGYEQGRFEALAHFDGSRYKGATVTYNIIEW
ncbi:glycoprotease [Selenomonas sp. oral taxon 920]|uniref:glycoprotease n=1 Tax=Selenomonas sp. oral taxon 920 TaxID=1884263 RepID=UPI000840C3F4|nr:glycoprotease [Selenomonas sp. oral taxon 920]AOH47506.1 glycoprotease [Selenomonas sp. oral taxon 920]